MPVGLEDFLGQVDSVAENYPMPEGSVVAELVASVKGFQVPMEAETVEFLPMGRQAVVVLIEVEQLAALQLVFAMEKALVLGALIDADQPSLFPLPDGLHIHTHYHTKQ